MSLFENEYKRLEFKKVINSCIGENNRSIIYSLCYPNDSINFPKPQISWDRAYKMVDKCFFDDVFFSIHMYVASKGQSMECSKNKERFASKCNRTSEIMGVLSFYLREYIDMLELVPPDEDSEDSDDSDDEDEIPGSLTRLCVTQPN